MKSPSLQNHLCRLQSHFGCTKNLIHYHIIFHPVIGGLERWSGRCRIVVEFSHIAVRPLRTRRVPALLCFSQSDSACKDEHFAWEAIYVPRPAESFDQWKQAAPLRIWHEGDLRGQSVPGMLLHGYCRTAPADDPILFNVLQEIGLATVDLHYFAVADDGRALGQRTCQLPRWQISTRDQLLTCGSEIWPELRDPQLLIAANPMDGGLAIMLYHQVWCQSHRAFWCSITLEANTQETAHLRFAVRTPWPCTLQELRGHLGFRNPQVDTIFVGDTLLPELQDGDHLHLRGALRPQLCQHHNVRTPMNPTGLEEWDQVGFLPRPRSEAICLHEAIDGNHYRPPQWTGSTGAEVGADGVDFREVLALWDWLDASCPEVCWNLPDGVAWHPASYPWTTTSWWSLDQVEMKIKNIWNHHLGKYTATKC